MKGPCDKHVFVKRAGPWQHQAVRVFRVLFFPVVHAWQSLYSMLGTCCTLHAWHLPICMTGIYRTVGLAPTVLHAWHLPCCTPGVHRNYASHYLQSFWLAWVGGKARFFTHQMASHIDAPRSAVELRAILRSMHFLRRFGPLLLQSLAIYRLLASSSCARCIFYGVLGHFCSKGSLFTCFWLAWVGSPETFILQLLFHFLLCEVIMRKHVGTI